MVLLALFLLIYSITTGNVVVLTGFINPPDMSCGVKIRSFFTMPGVVKELLETVNDLPNVIPQLLLELRRCDEVTWENSTKSS